MSQPNACSAAHSAVLACAAQSSSRVAVSGVVPASARKRSNMYTAVAARKVPVPHEPSNIRSSGPGASIATAISATFNGVG